MSADNETLFDKLKSMGVQVGAKNVPNPAQPATSPAQQRPRRRLHPIEEVISGVDTVTPYGSAFLSEQVYPNGYQHGWINLCDDCALEILSAWGHAERLTDPAIRNVVFLDTETTGLMGGTGTNVFLVGVGCRTEEGFRLAQFFLRDPSHEQAMLAALNQWLSSFNVVVTFNGRGFDIPLLTARYTLTQLPVPFGAFDHLDLLTLARKLWRDRLPSRALGDLEKEIVRFYRTGEDIPGWMIPQMYFDYLRSGDARPMAGIFYHNAMDILSLAALFNHMAALLTKPAHLLKAADGGGIDLAAIARLYEELGWLEQAAALYEASLDHGLPEDFFFKTIERYATMQKKQGDWEQAVRLWQKSAERGSFTACIELAKYFEHHARQYPDALYWTDRAKTLVPSAFTFAYSRRDALRELDARTERLQKKLNHKDTKGTKED